MPRRCIWQSISAARTWQVPEGRAGVRVERRGKRVVAALSPAPTATARQLSPPSHVRFLGLSSAPKHSPKIPGQQGRSRNFQHDASQCHLPKLYRQTVRNDGCIHSGTQSLDRYGSALTNDPSISSAMRSIIYTSTHCRNTQDRSGGLRRDLATSSHSGPDGYTPMSRTYIHVTAI